MVEKNPRTVMTYHFFVLCFFLYVFANDAESTSESATEHGGDETETIFVPYFNLANENAEPANGDQNRTRMPPIMKIPPPNYSASLFQESEEPDDDSSGDYSSDFSDDSSALAWISRPFREGLTDFSVKASANPLCKIQSALYEQHLKNNTL